jgi:regulator of sirC expression with transglutaminase-like and TPR domain
VIINALKARKIFSELAALDEDLFALDRAALALGLEEYPNLDIDSYLRRLDILAGRTEVLAGQHHSVETVIQCLNEVLFVQEGLRGNSEDYYDPRNSYLNEVMDRKAGIPISLSVIYIEVARRLDFPVQGVGLPGHFILKCSSAEQDLYIDAFEQGKILSMKDCQEFLDRIYGGTITIHPTLLQPMDKKAIITRMLFNLKGIYYQKEEFDKALAIVERILLLNPGISTEIRDRGLLYMQTSLFAKALADLEYYMNNAPAPEDGSSIQNHIKTLRSIVGSTN